MYVVLMYVHYAFQILVDVPNVDIQICCYKNKYLLVTNKAYGIQAVCALMKCRNTTEYTVLRYNAKMYIFAFTLQSRCPKDMYITFPIDLPLTLIHISCIICTYTVLVLNFNEHKNMRARKYFN